MRIRVFNYHENRIIAEAIVHPHVDVSIGQDEASVLVVPEWTGPTLVLLSAEQHLHLGPGMRVHMCHDNGEDRLEGEFEELRMRGVTIPILVTVSKLNIRLQAGIFAFVKFLSDDEPDW